MRKSALLLIILLVPLALALFLGVLIVQQQRTEALRQDLAACRGQNEALQTQNAYYRASYAQTLDDIKRLSSIYGGERYYEESVAQLRAADTDALLAQWNLTATYHNVSNPSVYGEYVRKGIINTSCLTPVPVDTLDDDVLIILNVSAVSNVYIDGNLLREVPAGMSALSVPLPRGQHELTVLGGAISGVQFDTIRVPGSAVVSDAGEGWEVFDCRLGTPGAQRLLVDKS